MLRRRRLFLALFVLLLVGFYHEIAFEGRTFLPLGIGYGGVMASAGPWAFQGTPRPDLYRWDRGASSWQIEPQARAIGAAYAAGEAPLWNPHEGFGAPLAANAQSGAFDLLRLPVFVSGHPVVWDAYYLLRALLGLLLTTAFLRSLGLAGWASAFGALAFGFSGFTQLLGNNHFVEVWLLLPGVLWGVELILANRWTLGITATALAAAASILAGMPEVTLLTLTFAAAYTAWRLASLLGPGRRPFPVIARGAAAATGFTIGILLAAPLVLPLAEYLVHAFSIHTPDIQLGLAYHPLASLVHHAVPYLPGPPLQALLAGPPPGVKGYSGAVVMALAALGAVASTGSRLPGARFWPIAAALLAAKEVGVPVVNDLGRLPLFNLTLVADWAEPILTFALAVLAALGLQAVLCQRLAWPRLLAALALLLAYLAGSLALNEPLLRALPLDHLLGTVGLACAAASLTWLALLARPWLGAKAVGAACCGLLVAELYLLAPHGVYQDRADPLARPPFVDLLLAEQHSSWPFRLYATDGLLHPGLATAFGLDDLRAVNGLYPSRYVAYVRSFLAPIFDRYTGVDQRSGAETRLDANPWLDLANVRFLVLPAGAAETELGLADALAAGRYTYAYRGEVDVLENVRVFPRAFLVSDVIPVPDQAAAEAAMKSRTFDPTSQAVVEASPDSLPPLGPDFEAHRDTLSLSRSAQRLELAVQLTAPRLLVVTDSFFPGWTATVDGQPNPIYPTNLAFRGVVVPAGQHQVTMDYRPPTFDRGLLAAALGLFGLFATALVGPRLSRRRATSSRPTPANRPPEQTVIPR